MTQVIAIGPAQRTSEFVYAALQWLRARFSASPYQSLHSLDDATLKDIGMHRSEIASIDAELYGGTSRTRRNLAGA